MTNAGIIPGIKVDTGAKDLAGYPGEKITEGLDGLRERLAEYYRLGARFAKWRAVIRIGEGIPSHTCIEANAHALARYAALCQEGGIVPIVEPEVLMDSDHTIESCYETTEKVLHIVFNQLYAQRVAFELMILKPNMVVPGKECPKQADVAQVAEATVTCLLRAVPAAVCGVAFLSGGQSSARASAHLNAMNARYASRLPWPLTFSYARAIQQPALQIWKGLDVNVKDAQEALLYRAKCNSAARQASIVMRWNMMKRLRLVLRVYIHTWVVRTRKAMNILEIEWREDKEGSRRFSAPTGSRVQAKGLSPETAQSLARASIGLI